MSCRQLLEYPNFPVTPRHALRLNIVMDNPAPKRVVINRREQLLRINVIPDRESFEAACSKVKVIQGQQQHITRGPWIEVAGIFYERPRTTEERKLDQLQRGERSRIDFSDLSEIIATRNFLDRLALFDGWVNNFVRKTNSAFVEWFEKKVMMRRVGDVYHLGSSQVLAPGATVSGLEHVYSLQGTKWLTAPTLGAILGWLQCKYPQVVFIPPSNMQEWAWKETPLNYSDVTWNHSGTWTWEDLVEGRLDIAYTIANINENHWIVVRINLKSCTMAFGDGLYSEGIERYKRIGEAALKWIQTFASKQEFSRWKNSVSSANRIDVPKQEDGHSCGIIAAYAIENDLHSGHPGEGWRTDHIESYRARYMACISGYFKVSVCHIPFCL
jgi:hypothetical protein